jgi:hypothetical protein
MSSFRPFDNAQDNLQPESSIFERLDTGVRRCDELIRGSNTMYAADTTG